MKTIIASLAAASLAFVPLAAQANTRAAESNVSLAQTIAAPARTSSTVVEGEQLAGEDGIIELVIAAAAIITGIIIYEIVDSKGIFD